MDSTSFGEYIITLRKEKNLSQRQLARITGIANSTISRIEADLVKPDPMTLAKLSSALDVDKSILMIHCGYSEIPEELVMIARRTDVLTKVQKKTAYRRFNETIDNLTRTEPKKQKKEK